MKSGPGGETHPNTNVTGNVFAVPSASTTDTEQLLVTGPIEHTVAEPDGLQRAGPPEHVVVMFENPQYDTNWMDEGHPESDVSSGPPHLPQITASVALPTSDAPPSTITRKSRGSAITHRARTSRIRKASRTKCSTVNERGGL